MAQDPTAMPIGGPKGMARQECVELRLGVPGMCRSGAWGEGWQALQVIDNKPLKQPSAA